MGKGLLLDSGEGSRNPVARNLNKRQVLIVVEDAVLLSSLSLPLLND